MNMDQKRISFANSLREVGVPKEIINTPAIFESCFKDYCESGNNYVRLIERREDGVRVKIADVEYAKVGNSFIKSYLMDSTYDEDNWSDVKIIQELNKYGVAESLEYTSVSYGPLDGGLSYSYTLKRENGKIVRNVRGGESKKEEFLDLGSIDLETELLVLQDNEKALDTFDHVAKEAVANYPELKEYYTELREDVVKQLAERDLPERDSESKESYEREISQLKKQLDEANNRNKQLEESNRQLTSQLKKSMQICEAVKKSKFASVFFGRKKSDFTQEQPEEK